MKSKNIKIVFKLLVSLTMLPAPFISETASAKAAGGGGGGKCEPRKKCESAFEKLEAQQKIEELDASRPSTGPKDGAARIQGAGMRTSTMATGSKETCEKEKKKCDEAVAKKTCTKEDCEAIEGLLKKSDEGLAIGNNATAGGAKTQAATSSGDAPPGGGESKGKGGESSGKGGGGGSDPMMGAMLGAALGAGMGMMMQKKKEEEAAAAAAAAQQAGAYNGALQANGAIDCSKPDAMAYRDCGTKIEARCSTILDDPTCQQFAAMHCGAGAPATIMVQPQTPPNVTFGVNPATLYATGGEGVGSQFCQGVMGWNFCKTAGRESCPSCQQISRNQSPACAQNPALCIAQNSSGEIEKAKMNCPTDPAFANPTFSAGGALGAPAVAGLPAVVLPQNGTVAGSANGGAVAGVSTQSASGGASGQAGEAAREGISNGNSQANYANANGSNAGGAGSVIGSSGYAAKGSAAGGREFASVNGMKPSTASAAGPASDVEGQYGPSLFSTSSQVIRRRCLAGRLNNCP